MLKYLFGEGTFLEIPYLFPFFNLAKNTLDLFSQQNGILYILSKYPRKKLTLKKRWQRKKISYGVRSHISLKSFTGIKFLDGLLSRFSQIRQKSPRFNPRENLSLYYDGPQWSLLFRNFLLLFRNFYFSSEKFYFSSEIYLLLFQVIFTSLPKRLFSR